MRLGIALLKPNAAFGRNQVGRISKFPIRPEPSWTDWKSVLQRCVHTSRIPSLFYTSRGDCVYAIQNHSVQAGAMPRRTYRIPRVQYVFRVPANGPLSSRAPAGSRRRP